MSGRDEKKKHEHGTESEPFPALEREIEPQGDLWAGIARRIDPGSAEAGAEALQHAAEDPNAPLPDLTRRLPRETEPVRDLWPAVRRRIAGAEPRAVELEETGASWIAWAGWAVAAAALVLAFQIPALENGPEPTLQLASAPEDMRLPIQQVQLGRVEARARLMRVLSEDSSISPATRAIVERNLETIDDALAEIEEALAADPGNATLYRLLYATYRQEAEIVAQVTRRGQAGAAPAPAPAPAAISDTMRDSL